MTDLVDKIVDKASVVRDRHLREVGVRYHGDLCIEEDNRRPGTVRDAKRRQTNKPLLARVDVQDWYISLLRSNRAGTTNDGTCESRGGMKLYVNPVGPAREA